MQEWIFEPGHTAAEFRVRHMMVTWVRGHFKNIEGVIRFDPADPTKSSVEVTIDTKTLWTGEPQRDEHLRSTDFLDAEHHPLITFRADKIAFAGQNDFTVTGELTIRGVTKQTVLDGTHLGQWSTPYWVGDVDKGPVLRAGFLATTRINRHDFGVSWNAPLDHGGMVVGNDVFITIDVEALREEPWMTETHS